MGRRNLGGIVWLLLGLVSLILSPSVWACEDCGESCTACVCGCGGEGAGGGLNSGVFALNAAAFRSENVNMMSWLPLSSIGAPGSGRRGSAIWGWTDPETGKEYALYGISNGTSFIDITNPSAPVYLGMLPTATGETVWRELQTYRNYLYVASDGNGSHGVQIFDLTRLRGVIAPRNWTADARYTGVTNVHTVSINEQTGFAYLNGSNRSQHILNLTNPLAPVSPRNYTNGYVHDSLIVTYNGPDTRYTGREIAFNSQGSLGLRIVDFTDKTKTPVVLSSRTYTGLGYTHQGWLTEDQGFLILNDEFDENNNVSNPNMRTKTHFWDVRDLQSPRYLGAYIHNSRVIDHNLFIRGNRVVMSNYTAGLRVFDINNLVAIANGPRNGDGTAQNIQQALSPVGFFDTYPADDSREETSFNGQWGNYPFFPSGTIIAGDRNNGLFVLRLGAAVPTPAVGTVTLQNFVGSVSSQSLQVQIRDVGSTSARETFTVTPNASGRFTVNSTLRGTFEVAVKGSHWLRKKAPLTLTGFQTTYSVSLINGDVNRDNQVTSVDLSLVGRAFNTRPGTPKWNANADLNGDSRIDTIDRNIVTANLRRIGDK